MTDVTVSSRPEVTVHVERPDGWVTMKAETIDLSQLDGADDDDEDDMETETSNSTAVSNPEPVAVESHVTATSAPGTEPSTSAAGSEQAPVTVESEVTPAVSALVSESAPVCKAVSLDYSCATSTKPTNTAVPQPYSALTGDASTAENIAAVTNLKVSDVCTGEVLLSGSPTTAETKSSPTRQQKAPVIDITADENQSAEPPHTASNDTALKAVPVSSPPTTTTSLLDSTLTPTTQTTTELTSAKPHSNPVHTISSQMPVNQPPANTQQSLSSTTVNCTSQGEVKVTDIRSLARATNCKSPNVAAGSQSSSKATTPATTPNIHKEILREYQEDTMELRRILKLAESHLKVFDTMKKQFKVSAVLLFYDDVF